MKFFYTAHVFLRQLGRALSIVVRVAPLQLSLLLVLILLEGCVPAASMRIAAQVIDTIVGSTEKQGPLFTLCTAWALLLLLKDMLSPLLLVLQGNVADKLVFFMNKKIIEKANAIKGLKVFETSTFHDTVQLLQTQAHHKPINLVVTVVGLFREMATIFGCLFLLLPLTRWITILILLCSWMHCRIFSILQKEVWKESLNRSTDSRTMSYLSSLATSAQAVKEAKFFPLGTYLITEYRKTFTTVYTKIFRLRMKQLFWPLLPLAFSMLVHWFIFFNIATKALTRQFTVGRIGLTLQLLSQLHASIAGFGEWSGWMQGHLLFFEKYYEFLTYDEEIFEPKGTEPLLGPPFFIEFVDVSFVYPDGHRGVEDLSFKIFEGEKIALVGCNGSGKSTLIKLLCGLYAPQKGAILINGVDIKMLDLERWQARIAPVFQNFCRFNFTLEKNITLNTDPARDAQLLSVLDECNLSDWIKEAEQGVYTKLGAIFGGTELSGGQWQKIALARALYKEATFYLLDEPTSALDPISEHHFYKKIHRRFKEKTVVFSTHRLGHVVVADKIVLLERGKLLGIGTHLELMSHAPLYKKMFSWQAADYLQLQEQPQQASPPHLK